MLTSEQLAEIKSNIISGLDLPSKHITFDAGQIELLLTDHERLTRHNQRMAAALEVLANGNWQVEIRDNPWDMGGDEVYIWSGDNPQQLAEQALAENEQKLDM